MKIKKIFVMLIIFLTVLNASFGYNENIKASEEIQTFEFTESIQEFNKPDAGIYRPTAVRVSPDSNSTWWKRKIQYANGLVHLRIGLKNFTKKYNKIQDYDITDDVVEKLNTWINQVREAGGTAIVRFAYDDFDGIKDLEPSIEQIERNIEQLQHFFEENEDIISCVETGFLGPYGEQHSSSIVTAENLKKVTDKLLEVVPESRTVSLRRPRYYCYATGADLSKINEDLPDEKTDAYRIGVFNDGYLGSRTDLGTFTNRKIELQWLNNQATHTLYGGEVVWGVENEVDENGNKFNSPEHIQEEMFITHTSYLNEEWNYKIINSWKDTTYAGKDELYKNSSVFTYVKNHLGYRLVLKKVILPKVVRQNDSFSFNVELENVGAGNVVNEKRAYIILKNEENEYSFITDIDIRKLYSLEKENYEISLTINLENKIGKYDIYLKILDKNADISDKKRTIRFANNEDVWNSELGANKIGNIEIKEANRVINPKGDINKDGNVTINDLAKLKLHLIEKKLIEDELSKELADMDLDGNITVNDLAILKLLLIK